MQKGSCPQNTNSQTFGLTENRKKLRFFHKLIWALEGLL